MTTLTSTEILALALVVVLAVVVVGLLVFLLRRLKSRRAKLLDELEDRPALTQDRAFNRIAMARREAGILSGQGVDVQHAQELIGEAQGAFNARHYDQAFRQAQSAHEALVNARQQGARSTGAPLPSRGSGNAPSTAPPPAVAAAPAAAAAPVPPPAAAIPKNRAESQFQLRLLFDELAALQGRRSHDPAVAEATALRTQAQAAFDKGNFTEAFRLALRGRRTLGGTVESLPPAAGPGVATARGLANGGPTAPDAGPTADSVAGAERCPDCGYPTLPGDAFCRGCGRPRTALTCPSCGAPRVADESYCGRCGARFP